MIKRANNKKKKGFTLIELIIVLAVMAIIALIAIPNFAAVRNNSKVKADLQSCETIKRTALMLVSDETLGATAEIKVSVAENGAVSVSGITDTDNVVADALAEVKAPQAKKCTGTKEELVDTKAEDPTIYSIVITDGSVEVVTGPVKKVEEGNEG